MTMDTLNHQITMPDADDALTLKTPELGRREYSSEKEFY
jgi:hypothetical protein